MIWKESFYDRSNVKNIHLRYFDISIRVHSSQYLSSEYFFPHWICHRTQMNSYQQVHHQVTSICFLWPIKYCYFQAPKLDSNINFATQFQYYNTQINQNLSRLKWTKSNPGQILDKFWFYSTDQCIKYQSQPIIRPGSTTSWEFGICFSLKKNSNYH